MATQEDERYYDNLWKNNGCSTTTYAAMTIIVGVLLLFCSCATKKEYIDREVVKYEKQYVHDTTLVEKHDSVYHTIFQKGDTVYDTKYVEHTRWRDRIVVKSDTCWKDSIMTEYKEVTVEKLKIPKICYFSLFFCGIVIIFAIIKLIRWLRRI